MKVTVCFGSIRIVVPVGDGNITVAQLTEKSLSRFRKVAKKDPDEKITVHHLHSIADDGILDLDDVLSDVVDDRDVLVAVFEEETISVTPPLPDVAHLQALQNSQGLESWSGTEKECSEHSSNTSIEKHKRNNDSDYYSSNQSQESNQPDRVDKWVQDTARSSPTLSSIVEPARDRAIEPARERGIETSVRSIETPVNLNNERSIDRALNESNERGIEACPETTRDPDPQARTEEDITLNVEIIKDNIPLGLTVQYINTGTSDSGLYVTCVEEGGAAERDGRLQPGDKIKDINGVNLLCMPSSSLLAVFTEMASVASVRLEVLRTGAGLDTVLNNTTLQSDTSTEPLNESSPDNVEEFTQKSNKNVLDIKLNKGVKGLGFTIATRDYTNVAGASPIFIKTVHRHGAAAEHGVMQPNDILLKVNGLSLQGKSQQAVVGMMRQLEGTVVLTIKRKSGIECPVGEEKEKRTSPPPPPAPAPAPGPKAPSSPRTQLTLEIPLVTPEGKPIGLGISVKGKSYYVKSGEPRQDYGIFIKTILKGGAAALDGRLKPDDQLIKADGESLKGQSNKEAMQILKQSLERSTQSSHVMLVVARKDVLNLSAESRANNKHYSSFKDPRCENQDPHISSLASNPSKYRALSLSSPNLGRKKRNNVEVDSNRGVAFNDNVHKITTAGDVLESDEDVVFVGDLPEQATDAFDRDHIFRKSMKKIDHKPIDPGRIIKRASSHESIAQYAEKLAPGAVMKRGLSSESIFSGKDVDPIYDSINDNIFPAREPALTNESFQNAIINGPVPPANVATPPVNDNKPKSKSFLNFFSKKGSKKREDSHSSDVSSSSNLTCPDNPPSTGAGATAAVPSTRPRHTSTPKHSAWDPDNHSRRSDRSNHSRNVTTHHATSRDNSRDRPHDTRYDNTREHPRAPGDRVSPENNHRRSRSSDFYRDREMAERTGLGFVEHVKYPNKPRDPNCDYDRRSNHSNHSGRSKDTGMSRGARDSSAAGYKPYQSAHHLHARDSSAAAHHLRDERYLETMNPHSKFKYGRGSSPGPQYDSNLPYYPSSQGKGSGSNLRYPASSYDINKQYPRPDDRYSPRLHPSYSPMISTPISQFQGRHSSEQLSDV